MKKSEKEAQKKLAEMGKKHVEPFVIDKRGVRHGPDEGTITDGLLRRMAGLPPKRVKS